MSLGDMNINYFGHLVKSVGFGQIAPVAFLHPGWIGAVQASADGPHPALCHPSPRSHVWTALSCQVISNAANNLCIQQIWGIEAGA